MAARYLTMVWALFAVVSTQVQFTLIVVLKFYVSADYEFMAEEQI